MRNDPTTTAARAVLSRCVPERSRERDWIKISYPTKEDWLEALAQVEWEAGSRATSEAVRVTVEMWKDRFRERIAGEAHSPNCEYGSDILAILDEELAP